MALSETIAFSHAVDVADTITNPKNTLIVVTADHSHTMTINGYPSREDDITGHVDRGSDTYSILSYANGPSAESFTYKKQTSKYGKSKNPELPIWESFIYKKKKKLPITMIRYVLNLIVGNLETIDDYHTPHCHLRSHV